jgi:hypothetical protein
VEMYGNDGWQWCGAVWCDGWGGAVQCGRERDPLVVPPPTIEIHGMRLLVRLCHSRKYQQVEASLTINGDFGNKTRWTTSGSLLYSASVMSTIG